MKRSAKDHARTEPSADDYDGRRHIVARPMVELAPTLRPDGIPTQPIRRAIDVYLGWIERHPGAHTASVTSLAFGVVGFVDATVNHWLADRERTLTQDELAEFLTRSIWSLLDGNLRALGVRIDPHARLDELTVT